MTVIALVDASEPLRASLTERLVAMRGDAPDALTDAVLEKLRLPGGTLLRVRPRDFDSVREVESLAGPGRPTPYWASAWPAGVALTRAVAAAGSEMFGPGRRVLELGCGLGMPSVAAARHGATVLATDSSEEAVVYAAHNLALNDVAGDVAAVDWTDAGLLEGAPWDVVLAADVLYRRDNMDSLLRLLPAAVAPDGEAWIADPGRAVCREFLAAARGRWRVASEPRMTDDPKPVVRVHRLVRRRRTRSASARAGADRPAQDDPAPGGGTPAGDEPGGPRPA